MPLSQQKGKPQQQVVKSQQAQPPKRVSATEFKQRMKVATSKPAPTKRGMSPQEFDAQIKGSDSSDSDEDYCGELERIKEAIEQAALSRQLSEQAALSRQSKLVPTALETATTAVTTQHPIAPQAPQQAPTQGVRNVTFQDPEDQSEQAPIPTVHATKNDPGTKPVSAHGLIKTRSRSDPDESFLELGSKDGKQRVSTKGNDQKRNTDDPVTHTVITSSQDPDKDSSVSDISKDDSSPDNVTKKPSFLDVVRNAGEQNTELATSTAGHSEGTVTSQTKEGTVESLLETHDNGDETEADATGTASHPADAFTKVVGKKKKKKKGKGTLQGVITSPLSQIPSQLCSLMSGADKTDSSNSENSSAATSSKGSHQASGEAPTMETAQAAPTRHFSFFDDNQEGIARVPAAEGREPDANEFPFLNQVQGGMSTPQPSDAGSDEGSVSNHDELVTVASDDGIVEHDEHEDPERTGTDTPQEIQESESTENDQEASQPVNDTDSDADEGNSNDQTDFHEAKSG